MKPTEIDDLLDVTAKNLVFSYERKNLNGNTLAGVNTEYKTIQSRKSGILNTYLWMQVLVTVVAMIIGLEVLANHRSALLLVPIFVIFTVITIWYANFYLRKKMSRTDQAEKECAQVLRDFRTAAENLYSFGLIRKDAVGYSIQKNLLLRAGILLAAENKFKKVRMLERADTLSVLNDGNFEITCRAELESMLQATEKFGLIFDKADLFRLAKKDLEKVS